MTLSQSGLATTAIASDRTAECICCPDGAIGGLADYATDAATIAIPTDGVAHRLAPINSDAVAVIVGFTELGVDGRVLQRRPPPTRLRRHLSQAPSGASSIDPGAEMPVFRRGNLTFGIVICNDSNDGEPARVMAGKDASVPYIPSNNQLPLGRSVNDPVDDAHVVAEASAFTDEMLTVELGRYELA